MKYITKQKTFHGGSGRYMIYIFKKKLSCNERLTLQRLFSPHVWRIRHFVEKVFVDCFCVRQSKVQNCKCKLELDRKHENIQRSKRYYKISRVLALSFTPAKATALSLTYLICCSLLTALSCSEGSLNSRLGSSLP